MRCFTLNGSWGTTVTGTVGAGGTATMSLSTTHTGCFNGSVSVLQGATVIGSGSSGCY